MAELDRASMGPVQGTEAREGRTHWPRPGCDCAFQRIYNNASLEEVFSKQAPIRLSRIFQSPVLTAYKTQLIILFFSLVTQLCINKTSADSHLQRRSICYRLGSLLPRRFKDVMVPVQLTPRWKITTKYNLLCYKQATFCLNQTCCSMANKLYRPHWTCPSFPKSTVHTFHSVRSPSLPQRNISYL